MVNEHTLYLNFNSSLKDKIDDKSDIEFDISELIGEISDLEKSLKEINYNIDNINETLKSSDIANIQNEINQCIKK